MFKITKIEAEEIKDSRGNPTIKVTVFAGLPAQAGEHSGSFSVPSGASTGAHEAHVLPVPEAIKNINEIIVPALIDKDIENQHGIDQIMLDLDGTPNKTKLGGNAMIGVSIACAKAAAKAKGLEVFEHLRVLSEMKSTEKIPYLYMNLINGGKHVSGDKLLAFQEYHIVPITENVGEAIDVGIKIQNTLKEIIDRELGSESLVLGDEGGYAPKITDIREPFELLRRAIEENNFDCEIRLALDVAASSFYKPARTAEQGVEGLYEIDGKKISKEELVGIYDSLIKEFNLLSIEDPFEEEDFESFSALRQKYPKLLVVGDDLTVTNKDLLQKAIKKEAINAIIIKPNQIGTLSETLETMKLAGENNVELIVSHRSGETDDDFIADLAYAFGCYGLKSGAPKKPERRIKYDRLKKLSKL